MDLARRSSKTKSSLNTAYAGWLRRMRDELLNETMFRRPVHARAVIADWVTDYNTQRPHSALGYQTPAEFALQ